MIRTVTNSLFAVALALPVAPAAAQAAADAPHQVRKAAKARKPVAPTVVPPHGINAPSTDFSKIERSGEEAGGPDAPSLRPAMGAGGMGLGGSF